MATNIHICSAIYARTEATNYLSKKLKFTLTPIATTTSPESQTYPVTTGAIFHKLSPKLQHSRYPFSPDQQSAETTEADWRGGARETERNGAGEEYRKEGEAAGC